MLALDLTHPKQVEIWVQERLPEVGEIGFGPCTAIGIDKDGDRIAGAVYHSMRLYQPWHHTIEMSFAATSPEWARRGIICALLAYPLIQLRCGRITATARESNKRARRLFLGLGFVEEGLVRKGYGVENAVVYGMLHSDAWRWIKGVSGVKEAA